MPIRLRGGGGGSAPPAEAVATRNILNGVLNCAWDKTSATPKLLEIYNTSFVKVNIDADNPLTMAFANGWDDKDRPAQVIKTLATAPSNIDLSGKASCHVQICAKVVNDEVTITTHDIYDPAWVGWANVVPNFSANPTNGWTVAAGYDVAAMLEPVKSSPADQWHASPPYYWELTPPRPLFCYQVVLGTGNNASSTRSCRFDGQNFNTLEWETLGGPWVTSGTTTNVVTQRVLTPPIDKMYMAFRFIPIISNPYLHYCRLYEHPLCRYVKSENKVKDVNTVEQLWINLGYATVDASGNITALNHYTDLRNNYPGGMRVEA